VEKVHVTEHREPHYMCRCAVSVSGSVCVNQDAATQSQEESQFSSKEHFYAASFILLIICHTTVYTRQVFISISHCSLHTYNDV